MSTVVGHSLEEIAQELFGLITQLALATQAHQRRGVELKEFEYLTLAILDTHPQLIVGDIQRVLGVLPAQMSRIIRSLESRQPPLIECQINPRDKRKVDVRLTGDGVRALAEFRELRVRKLVDLLKNCTDEDREDLARLVLRLHDMLKEASAEVDFRAATERERA